MNEDTLVTVHCYQGDAHQVRGGLKTNLRHGCPILVLSPEDSPVVFDAPASVSFAHGGKRGYFGQDSLDRQVTHMKMLLDTPYRYFLMNDSDSYCLAREIPSYLYGQAKNMVWSNIVNETRPHESPYPKLAFHPSYFMERQTIEKLLKVVTQPSVRAHPVTPFIDWFMLALTEEAHVGYASYPNGVSFPAWRHGFIPETKALGHDYVHKNDPEGERDGVSKMLFAVSKGAVMVHSVKHPDILDALVNRHEWFALWGPDGESSS